MHELFSEEKYRVAANKAYEFLKRMLDPSAWEVQPYYGDVYDEKYAYQLMWGGAKNIPDDAKRIDPNYIQPDEYYYPGYTGVMQGTFKLPEGENPGDYAVAIYRVSDAARSLECFCPLFVETEDDGTETNRWYSGRLVEAWEYYLQAYDRESPYMSDGAGGYVPWEPSELDPYPEKFYKTEFTTTKVVYWYWAEAEVGGSSTYAYEIELVRKDWTVPVTDSLRQTYMSRPAPREGYTRTDYLGIAGLESYNVFELMTKPSVKEYFTGWSGKDDLPVQTPELPEYISEYDFETILQSQSFSLTEPEERHKGHIEYGYSRFVDYKIYLYAFVLGDAEYLNAETSLWSDVIYPISDNPPPIPALEEEITDITVMLGSSASRRNITFLSTVDAAEGAEVEIVGGSVTYKAEVKIPDGDFEYILRVGDTETPVTAMAGRPETSNVYRFIAAGDPQLTNEKSIANWQESLSKAFSLYPDAGFIATLGDNVDAQVDMSLAEQQFTGFLSPPEMKTHPLLTVMGNHDDNMGFAGHFFAPRESSYGVKGGQGDYWTRHDKTLIMVLNTNVKDTQIQEHIDFINETVDYYVNANGRPAWTIVMFHHSIFQPTNTAEEEQYVLLRNALAPCFSDNRVDLVLMGHVHSYCRTHVLDCSDLAVGETVTEAAIVPDSGGSEFTKTSKGQTLYVTLNSASGSKFYPLSGEHWYAAKTEQELIPNISCVDVDESRIVITTHRTSDMSIVDQFTLRK